MPPTEKARPRPFCDSSSSSPSFCSNYKTFFSTWRRRPRPKRGGAPLAPRSRRGVLKARRKDSPRIVLTTTLFCGYCFYVSKIVGESKTRKQKHFYSSSCCASSPSSNPRSALLKKVLFPCASSQTWNTFVLHRREKERDLFFTGENVGKARKKENYFGEKELVTFCLLYSAASEFGLTRWNASPPRDGYRFHDDVACVEDA